MTDFATEEAQLKRSKACPDLKLYYFDVAGLGEAIRLVAHYGQLPFTDVRCTREEFDAMKGESKLAFGQLPALQVNDETMLYQSAAILRFVGKFAGLYPTDNDVLAAQIDAMLDQEKDMFTGVSAARYRERFGFGSLDEATAHKILEEIVATVLPRHLTFYENMLKQSSTGWLCNTDKPTIADFSFVQRLMALGGFGPSLLEPFPLLLALKEKFMSMPEIVEYYANKNK